MLKPNFKDTNVHIPDSCYISYTVSFVTSAILLFAHTYLIIIAAVQCLHVTHTCTCLYQEDIERMPLVSTFFTRLEKFGNHTTYPAEKDVKEAKKQPKV